MGLMAAMLSSLTETRCAISTHENYESDGMYAYHYQQRERDNL